MAREVNELRAGVIGTGFIGPVHIEALQRNGIRVSAICGSDKARSVEQKLQDEQKRRQAEIDAQGG